MSVVATTILDFGRIVLNFISYLIIDSITKTKGVAISRWMFRCNIHRRRYYIFIDVVAS